MTEVGNTKTNEVITAGQPLWVVKNIDRYELWGYYFKIYVVSNSQLFRVSMTPGKYALDFCCQAEYWLWQHKKAKAA